MSLAPPARPVATEAFADGQMKASTRMLATEAAVAISYNGTAHAVMMATPKDLEDLARGFTLSEGIALVRSEIEAIDVVVGDVGIDVQVRLATEAEARLSARRRAMAGPVGCGLCGLESIEAAMRKVPVVSGTLRLKPSQIADAVAAMGAAQTLNQATRSVHAAGLHVGGQGLVAIREDVGRHNGLDKLIGASDPGDLQAGVIVMTSRLSVELVQKCAVAGCSVLIGVSAPTTLAVDVATQAGITLVGIARGADFEIFSHGYRIDGEGAGHGT